MPATKVIIIYSPNQNRRRTVIIPDDDSQIPIHTANIVKGEAVLVGDISDYRSIGPDAMLVAHTGKQPSSDRCIVHSNGKVVACVLGDPLIDTHPAGALTIDNTGKATVGLSVDNGVAVIPAVGTIA